MRGRPSVRAAFGFDHVTYANSRARLETLFPVRRSWLAAMPGSVSDLSVDERTTQTHSAVCVALLTARHNVHGDSFDGRCGEVG